jgi:hypothetical protein
MVRTQGFRWDFPVGLVALIAAVLALVPTLGWLLALHMRVDLGAFTRFATLPALLALAACEVYLTRRSPLLFQRFASGLVGGVAGTAAFDVVRAPATFFFHGAPDLAPMLGQYLRGETFGIQPTTTAWVLGYAYQYMLVGALVGAAYALALGRGRWYWAAIAGVLAGAGFTQLTPVRMLAFAEGYTLTTALTTLGVAIAAGGLVLGLVVQALGRTSTNALYVVFLREERVEAVRERV